MVDRRIRRPRRRARRAGRQAEVLSPPISPPDATPEAGPVLTALAERFGPVDKPVLPPLDELVLTILSQSTTDANRDRAWSSLRERYPEWEDARSASRSDLEETIRVAGLARQKAAAIEGVLDRLAEERGALDMTHLEDMPDEEAMDYLMSFRGVGVKTAACVLCFSLRRPVLPVDTHVLRVGRRLGWIPPKGSSAAAHAAIAGRVPPGDRLRMHLLFIALGRAVCTARSPRCEQCPLGDECPKVGVSAE